MVASLAGFCLAASVTAFAQAAALNVAVLDCNDCDKSLFDIGRGQMMLAYEPTKDLPQERYYIRAWGFTAVGDSLRSQPAAKLQFTVQSSSQTLGSLKFIFSYEYLPGEYFAQTVGVEQDGGVGKLEVECPKAFIRKGQTARYILALAPSDLLRGGDWFVINLKQISGFATESTAEEIPTVIFDSRSKIQPPRFTFWKNPWILDTTPVYLTAGNNPGVNFRGQVLKVTVATPVAMSGGLLGLEASTDLVNWTPLYCEQPAAMEWADRFEKRTLYTERGAGGGKFIRAVAVY